jgi:O-antigen/teichoic acid export membrane protein
METRGDKEKQRTAVSSSFLILFVNSILFFIVLWFVMRFFSFASLFLICAYLFSTMLFMHLQQLLRGLGFVKIYAWLSIANAIVILGLNLFFLLHLNYKLDGILLSIIIANLAGIIYILVFRRVISYIRLSHVNRKEAREMVKYSLPLVFNSISWWMMTGFDRYVIIGFLGIASNGIYAISNKYASFLFLLNSFFIPAWQDYVISRKKEQKEAGHYTKLVNQYFILQLSLVVFLSAICKYVVDMFIDSEYSEAWRFMPLLLLGAAFSSLTSFIGTFILVEKETYKLFWSSLFGSVVNIGINFLLIRHTGLYSACIGMVCGFFITGLMRYLYTRKQYQLKIDGLSILLLLGTLILVMYSLNSGNGIYLFVTALFSFLLVVFINMQIWGELYQYILGLIKKRA